MLTIIRINILFNNRRDRTRSLSLLAKAFPVTGSFLEEAFSSFLVIVAFRIVMPSASILSKNG
jgi:hypothetical protein